MSLIIFSLIIFPLIISLVTMLLVSGALLLFLVLHAAKLGTKRLGDKLVFRATPHVLFFLALAGTRACATPFRVMIDPAGTHNHSRVIQNIQEKTITLNCAEELKKEIEEAVPNCTVILTRTAGQATKTQATNYGQRANCSQIDLFLSLNFYQETDTKPHLYLYQFLHGTDNLFVGNINKAKPSCFTFYKEEQSYLFNHASSEKAAHAIQQIANQKQYASLFTTHTVIACPCVQLKGIIVPALVLDMGIAQATDWQESIKPLISTLVESIKIIAKQNS